MKKYKLLITSIIILLLSILNGWLGDWIFNTLTAFIYPFIIIIPWLICYIVCFVASIQSLLKNKIVFNYLPVVILIITTLLVLFFPFRIIRTKFELTLYENDRNSVIQMIKEGKIEIDEIGNAKLPDKYKRISVSGEIFIYQNNDEGTVIGFWILRGMMSSSVELIYSTGGEQLIKDNEKGHPIKSLKKLKDKWYYVITDY